MQQGSGSWEHKSWVLGIGHTNAVRSISVVFECIYACLSIFDDFGEIGILDCFWASRMTPNREFEVTKTESCHSFEDFGKILISGRFRIRAQRSDSLYSTWS